jgi:pantoate--beta-alanine ligase
MRVVVPPDDVRAWVSDARKAGQRVGFLATMGALHEGHLSLLDTLKRVCDVRVLSIFVNPTQFNDRRDFDAYKIDLDRDIALARERGTDLVFTPGVSDIYRDGAESWVTVDKLSQPLEGEFRPGHFRGVATVVTTLLNIVTPDYSIFGEKDFQQLRIVEQVVRDLHLPVKILRGEIVRETDGLAMSSRNVRLTSDGRKRSLAISRGLFRAQDAFSHGERSARRLEAIFRDSCSEEVGIEIQYVRVAREDTFQAVDEVAEPVRLLVAVFIEGVRLIDNIALA